MEEITGPVHGFWLACYTVQAAEGHYAYAKLCVEPPRNVWEAPGAVRKIAAGPCADAQEALHEVVERTRRGLKRRVESRLGTLVGE